MKISLEGKRAFVTAGGDGMGRTTAITMAELGAKVFTCDIDPSGLETLPDSITTWQCDVGDSDALDAIFDEILPDGLDILVNNAGVSGPTKLVEEITNDEWDQCMSICIDVPIAYSLRTSSGSRFSSAAWFAMTRSIRSPLTLPGTMPLTRMLSGPSSMASVSVNPETAYLAAT